ncbi:MAG TPA: response regulator, partial [Anaerolineales bacterium]|nr:response regulator [Anaerolineales bacterium]
MLIPLRLLLVEDNASDAELVLAELGLAGFAPQCVRVYSEAEFAARLSDEWDIIITDYDLPQFDGLRLLEQWRAHDLTVPVIVVTGKVGEEVAVECVRLGATDYLLKDRLTRLGPAVKR